VRATNIVNPSNTVAYILIGILVLSALLSIGIVLIAVFGAAEDQKANIAILVGALSPVLVTLVGFLTVKKVDAVHVQVNERMTQMLALAEGKSRAEGMAAERLVGAERAAGVEVNRAVVEADRSATAEAAAEKREPI